MASKKEMEEGRAITILENLRDEKITVCDLYPEAAEAVFNMAIDGIRKRLLLKEMQEELSSEIEALSPDSPYVFDDDKHGFCVNTKDALDLMLCALDRQKKKLETNRTPT